MSKIFKSAGAIVVLLEILPAISSKVDGALPIGGSHIAQLAVVLGLAFVIHEFISVLSNDGR